MTYIAVTIGIVILVLGLYACIRDNHNSRTRQEQEHERSLNHYNGRTDL